jgi:hypothetical protein
MQHAQYWKAIVVILLFGGMNAIAQSNTQVTVAVNMPLSGPGTSGGSLIKDFSEPLRPETVTIAESSSERLIDPSPIKLITPVRPAVGKEHARFFDRKNNFLIGASAAVIALDGLSTQRFLANPSCYEMNPIARPLVRSRFGSSAYFSSSFAGEVAAMRWAHKHNHHLLEHVIPAVVIGSEGFMIYHNYHLTQRYRMGY